MNPVRVRHGDCPVILSMPHVGTHVPDEIRKHLNANGLRLADTDWHIERLYDGLLPDATVIEATFHRYVIDANRDPSGASLYPGQNTTGLVPLTDFDGAPLWHEPPDSKEIERRRHEYHARYQAALAAEIERVRSRHGLAILFDCHSIRAVIPNLFAGVLPDFNVGTNDGRSCAPQVAAIVADTCANAKGYSHVLNGRFKGGWITRHHGDPASGVHAIQMELAQSAYLRSEAPPFAYDEAKAERLRTVLGKILRDLQSWAIGWAEFGHA